MKETALFNQETEKIWLSGIMGLVTGDALGCPVQFRSREEIALMPVTVMQGYGTYDMPPGTWTDDSSMALATLASIRALGEIDPEDIMKRFAEWIHEGAYTPYGEAFDIGNGTMRAVMRYLDTGDAVHSGGSTEYDNGNGSLMRILPACLYGVLMQRDGMLSDEEAVNLVHKAGALTHAHLRSQIACGLYFFLVQSVLNEEDGLRGRLQKGLEKGFAFYDARKDCLPELRFYHRLRDLPEFADLPSSRIRSSGYVVDTLEAVLWSLCRSGSFREALLTAVNLGDDTDTVGAIAGGLGGLFYGIEGIPKAWFQTIVLRDRIEALCRPL